MDNLIRSIHTYLRTYVCMYVRTIRMPSIADLPAVCRGELYEILAAPA